MISITRTIAGLKRTSGACTSGHVYCARVSTFVLLGALALVPPVLGASSRHLKRSFLGRWDLTVQTPSEEFPSWIEVTENKGQVTVSLVGRTGNVHVLPKAEIRNGEITFISSKEVEDRKDDMVFRGKFAGDQLVGTTVGPDGTPWRWTGKRAPTLKRDGVTKWGQPITLFNGRNLDGWRFSNPSQATNWKVDDGLLVNSGNGSEIISEPTFTDFKLHVEFKCGPISNSGVYLRGRYEVQVETDSAAKTPSHHTGGIYGFIGPIPEQPRKDGVWQIFDITFVGRIVTVIQNGITVIDHKAIPGITGGALDSHEELPGPIYLQGSEEGTVAYRNIVISPAVK